MTIGFRVALVAGFCLGAGCGLAFAQNLEVATSATQRMVVILKPTEVARQEVREGDTTQSIFVDQRVYANPRAWNAVSVKTASLIRDIENQYGVYGGVAFGAAVHGFGTKLSAAQIQALRSDPRVQEVFEDVPGSLAGVAAPPWADTPAVVPSTSTYTTGWNLHAINLYNSGANDTPAYRTSGGYQLKSYVIDAGVQPHADLNFDWQTDHISFDCHDNEGGNCTLTNPSPTNPYYVYTVACDPHATHVAGIVGAHRQTPTAIGVEGVAPGAQIVSVKVINYCAQGSGTQDGLAYTSGVIAAINWVGAQAPDNGVDAQGRRRMSAVANMSIVWPLDALGQSRYVLPPGAATALSTAIAAAVNNGVFFSFAAGNSNEPACNIYPAAIGSTIAGAVAVGAIQANGSAMNQGDKIATYGPCVEIWAPGQDVHSTVAQPALGQPLPGAWGAGVAPPYQAGQHYYRPETGSSMAAPHVAGAALLVARKYQQAGLPVPAPADVETIIKLHVKSVGTQHNGTAIQVLTVDNL